VLNSYYKAASAFFFMFLSVCSYAECQIYPQNNIWNTAVDQLPVHPKSATWLESIGLEKSLHPDFGAGLYRGKPMGIPYNTVNQNTPRHRVNLKWLAESDDVPYPIPDDVKIEAGGDNHILSLDEENCILYELFAAKKDAQGQWSAGSGAIFYLSWNRLRPLGWTSADAAGLPIYPGLVRIEEVKKGEINHAIRFTTRKTVREYVWPATHFASRSKDKKLPPMGIRLRLKKNVKIDHLPLQAKIIAQALKTYGMILADNGGPLFVSGEPSQSWQDAQLQALKKLKGSDFEVVNAGLMMISPESGRVDIQP
jgi:hypothetical protein